MASTSAEFRAQRKARKAEAAEVVRMNAEAAKANLRAYRAAARGIPPVEEPAEVEPVGTGFVENDGTSGPDDQEDGHTQTEDQGTPPTQESSEQ
ncbi:hypothetical protein SEA_NUCCI_7 [Microbacterium phage Nucci]|nr:hypothetical protein SEA_NUCCI_7 [Microbacterium phage Nucci]QXO13601.1 hypothetical protein SEA_MANDALORIAN_7 [Microbacterium phage Mandalorian]